MRHRLTRLLLVTALWIGCAGEVRDPAAWIRGSGEERWGMVERQLRGLDVAMLEIGQRYQELYWAGGDRAWPYAGYQAGKIRLALENGIERRPKRRASAEALFLPALAEIDAAIAAREEAVFASAFERLTMACNACHGAEGVPTFRVSPPATRQSTIHPPE